MTLLIAERQGRIKAYIEAHREEMLQALQTSVPSHYLN